MTNHETSGEATVDLNAVGDALPTVIEDAARRGERLVIERGGVRLAVLVPDHGMREAGERHISNEEALALLDSMRARFADQTQEEIERETAKALAEVRAEMRAERAVRQRAS